MHDPAVLEVLVMHLQLADSLLDAGQDLLNDLAHAAALEVVHVGGQHHGQALAVEPDVDARIHGER
eukprot:2753280-Heterocapsa_arctica.AAC.1